MLAAQEDLKAILKEFTQGKSVGKDKVRPIILDSWMRCREKTVNHYQKHIPVVLEGVKLDVTRPDIPGCWLYARQSWKRSIVF